MDGETCTSCRFFRPLFDGAIKLEVGECHAEPPKIFMDEDHPVSAFPQIEDDEWCGSWKANQ